MNHKQNKNDALPFDGLKGLFQCWKSDSTSGFLVFLLAMPLSLGIAKASQFPPLYGILTAIVGGLVVSFFMGSKLSIKGPAAGLIVIVSSCVSAFGDGALGWQMTSGIIALAAILQILFGILKWGTLADYFPGSAIHGMLAAIGVIIMSKQINLLFGVDPASLKGLDPIALICHIPDSIQHENTQLMEIGLTCLGLMFLLNILPFKVLKIIPAPLIVLIISVPLGIVLHIKTQGAIHNYALVQIGSISDFFKNGWFHADFTGIYKYPILSLQYLILFSLIGSIESLLTAKAMDRLDPYKRKSNFNADLWAVGIGNLICGVLGALPMISEVARSSANIGYGAKTRWSNVFHGLFLLLAICFAKPIIEWIPNVALSAMLIYVGFKLAHPKSFVHIWKTGKLQFTVFGITIMVTLLTDLLLGVCSGIACEFIINWIKGLAFLKTFKCHVTQFKDKENLKIIIHSPITFSNLHILKQVIASVTNPVIIELQPSVWIDDTSKTYISDWIQELPESRQFIQY
jgi:MFS superfamily sulfate permease-like transporter